MAVAGTTTAEGVNYFLSVNDGMLFRQPFKRGDLVLELQPPLLSRNYEKHVRDVVTSLFAQDYGQTAASLFGVPPPKYTVATKKVPLTEWVRRWNAASERYVRLMREEAGNVNNVGELTRLLEARTPRGEEPWALAQMQEIEAVLSGITFAGWVLKTTDQNRGRQGIHVSTHNSSSLRDMYFMASDVGVLWSTTNSPVGCNVYLVCYGARAIDHGRLANRHGGLRFRVVVTNLGRAAMFRRLVLDSFPTLTPRRELAAAMLRLGAIVGGHFFQPDVEKAWQFVSVNAFLVPATQFRQPQVTAREFDVPRVARKRTYAAVGNLAYHPVA